MWKTAATPFSSTGYQAPDTLGSKLLAGVPQVYMLN